MANGIQLIERIGGGQSVRVDGRIVGEVRTISGDTVIWRPWYGCGTFQMSWGEFVRTLSPRH
jgi:hypothetical protein